jgi:cellulose biosynthesis protein BcsQ
MAAPPKHFDEARSAAIAAMAAILTTHAQQITSAVIVDDLFGRVSIHLWIASKQHKVEVLKVIDEHLTPACGQFWTKQINCSTESEPSKDPNPLMQLAWAEGSPVAGNGRLRLNDRVRHHSAWFLPVDQTGPIWSRADGPPVVVFHAFKGGAGRTTLLASYALARARRGDRVVVIDMDLDAPGVGTLLAADSDGTLARWGSVDYLLECPKAPALDDYFHVCDHAAVMGPGRIEVFPTGQLNDDYLPKLARVDLDSTTQVEQHPFGLLLEAIRERQPDVILVDGRAGLSSSAGLLLSGIAHLHVLIATASQQSVQGLERVIRHLGHAQAEQGRRQGECVVVQALVPEHADSADVAQSDFRRRLEDIFRDGYYAKEPSEDYGNWSLEDWENQLAPHVPVPISYRARLAHFSALTQVVELLVTDMEYLQFHRRLDERLRTGSDEPETDDLDPAREDIDG